MNGRDLGHYRIEVQLGSGGMGAVYRAADLRTGQLVALKTLLASRLNDAEQRKRLQQEARLASSLQHLNIVGIHEIGTAQMEDNLVDYISMELVDGQTIEHLAALGHPLPQALALDYSIQIAHGLAAAHAANIAHRDLKPSNLMVTHEGVVKILDFGLAKWTDPIQPDSYGETRSVQLGLTMAGTIVGSVAYMSPEQAEGKPLDSRTDIFSLGAVMYRMLSGREPFQGTSQVATLSAVLLKEPEPIAGYAAGVDPRFESIIRKCLRKDPAKRWQSMPDLALSLEELRDELAQPPPAPSIAPSPVAASTRRQWLMAGAGLLAGLAPTAYFASRRTPPATFQRLTFRRGDISSALFAPRGEIVYTAHWDGSPQSTFSSLPGSREARDLGLPMGKVLSVNANGEALMLTGEGSYGTLVKISLGGGAARPLLDNVSSAVWGPDGTSIAVSRLMGSLNRLEYPIGNVLHQKEGLPFEWLRVSPHDGVVAFFDHDAEIADLDLKVVDSAKQLRVLSRGWRTVGRLGWSPDGKDVWTSAGRPGESPQLTAVNRNGQERMMAQLPGFMVLHDISGDGALLLAAVRSKIAISAQGPQSMAVVDLSWFDASLVYDMTPDGTSVVFVELAYGEGRNSAIYWRNTDGSPAVKIGYGNRPAISPDGKRVACIFSQDNKSLLKILPTGAGEEQLLPSDGLKYEKVEWFADQRRLLVTAGVAGKPLRTYWKSVDHPELHPVTPEGVRASKISPDSRWAVASVEGKYRIFSIAGGDFKDIGLVEPGEQALRWIPNSTGFFVGRAEANRVRVDLIDNSTKQRRKVREIRMPEEGAEFYAVMVSSDARYYALSYQKDMAELYIARGIR